jgi:hypothetical protein
MNQQNPKIAALTPEQEELLKRLTRASVTANLLAQVGGSMVYQVTAGWPREELLRDPDVQVIADAESFEEAARAPHIYSLFVPKDARLTQEIAERILQRNPLAKTVFWEA